MTGSQGGNANDPRDGAPGPGTSYLVVAIIARPWKWVAQREGPVYEERSLRRLELLVHSLKTSVIGLTPKAYAVVLQSATGLLGVQPLV